MNEHEKMLEDFRGKSDAFLIEEQYAQPSYQYNRKAAEIVLHERDKKRRLDAIKSSEQLSKMMVLLTAVIAILTVILVVIGLAAYFYPPKP